VIKIIKSFKSLLFFKDIEVTILSSILMQDFKSIRRFIGDADNINIKQFSFDIRPFLRWADMAICAAGTTLWELCFYGISGIVGILSENQVMNARLLDKKKIFRSIGWYKGMTVDKLNFYMNDIWKRRDRFFMMREKAFNLVDGLGPQRVFAAMDKISAE
jgi:spore coat polysaccharide biosynthesis predicted glycosyltransferase SpsG